ncbi:MAG: retroviral-like aspartic protease family protein [Methylibium sp.]|uniref:retropepsin-like aspartic protease family protein n=1 Tax=Methylibium sp. TaxID=2067992 RepID=UPI001835A39C|nr:retropepsin-like aspartic protease [Methylibium sp.]MBA3598195.1 retroviral-like aspartic protease family protein [Methylibium sp.]
MNEFPRTLKIATVWLLLGVVVFLGFSTFQAQQQKARFSIDGSAIEIERGPDGHYHWPGTLNGREVDFLIDTGATRSAISAELARELDLEALGSVQSSTAGGVVRGHIARADLVLEGGVRAERLPLVVLPALGDKPLLGMDVLGRLHWQQQGSVLRIEAGRPR